MWEFKPGMKVVCVDADPNSYRVTPSKEMDGLKENQIYTIREIRKYSYSHIPSKYIGIKVEGIVRGGLDVAYHANRFRPLQTKSSELFKSIVEGVNTGNLVVEDDKYMSRFKKTRRKVTI